MADDEQRTLETDISIARDSALAMSLQGLISGSECAVPSNPLAQVLKHTEGDRSLQQVCAL